METEEKWMYGLMGIFMMMFILFIIFKILPSYGNPIMIP